MASHSPTPFNSQNINVYFTISVAACLILVIIALLIYSYRCLTSVEFLWQRLTCRIRREPSAAVETIPVCRYRKGQSFSNECSVCLTTFEEGEKVKQLPVCRHSFHAPCIDKWLCSHTSCPSCRAIVLKDPEECPRTEAVENTTHQQPQQLLENRSVAFGIASA